LLHSATTSPGFATSLSRAGLKRFSVVSAAIRGSTCGETSDRGSVWANCTARRPIRSRPRSSGSRRSNPSTSHRGSDAANPTLGDRTLMEPFNSGVVARTAGEFFSERPGPNHVYRLWALISMGFGDKESGPPRLQWSRVWRRRAGCLKQYRTELAAQDQSVQSTKPLQTFAVAPLCESYYGVTCVDYQLRIALWPILSCSCHSV